MGAKMPVFTQEEMAIDEALGFPKAYALLCRNSVTNGPFAQGPPLSFIPYALKSQEALRVKELDQLFPIINPEVCSSTNPRTYANFLWKQLDHLGNAGFEPALFRVDRFGNVVYRHADSASPLAWDIDHWFPCSRGGKTVACNLRILQWQVCKKKKNKLDFLIPWWDLQLGISVNQFLSIFVSKNSDFRNRAFSFLFPDGGGKELNCLQNLHFHSFPQNFMDAKRKQGLAPAAIVLSQNCSETLILKAVDLNSSLIPNSPFPALIKSFQKDVGNPELKKFGSSISKENSQSAIDHHENNPYRTISCERHLLRQRKEAKKLQAEINQLDEELNEIKQQNDSKRIELQELEAVLIRRRRRVEKCRRLSEAQASYRSLLEKMIRDVMHQNVVYKEQLRLNQAASSVLMARLETQKAACDSSANEVRKKYKQRDELEMHTMPCLKQVSHGSQIYDDWHENSNHLSSIGRVGRPIKELRVFLEEEQKAFEAGISLSFDDQEESEDTECIASEEEVHCEPTEASKIKDDIPLNSKLKGFAIEEESYKRINDHKKQFSYSCSSLYSLEEGNDTFLVPKDQDLTINNKLKQIQHMERNVIKSSESCRMINDQERQTSHPCVSFNNVEGYDAVLVNDKLKQDQKKGLDAIKANESQKQWNLHIISHEQKEENEEFRNQVGEKNVEKWLQILLGNSKEGSPYSDSDQTQRNFNETKNNANIEIKSCTTNNSREKHYSDKSFSEKRLEDKCMVGTNSSACMVASKSTKSFGGYDKEDSKPNLPKCKSLRGLIPFPSSHCMSRETHGDS